MAKKFLKVAKAAKLLKLQANTRMSKKGHNSGDKEEFDYFAVLSLIEYFEYTVEAARKVTVARDALEGTFFIDF